MDSTQSMASLQLRCLLKCAPLRSINNKTREKSRRYEGTSFLRSYECMEYNIRKLTNDSERPVIQLRILIRGFKGVA